jgi:hypothetical protein
VLVVAIVLVVEVMVRGILRARRTGDFRATVLAPAAATTAPAATRTQFIARRIGVRLACFGCGACRRRNILHGRDQARLDRFVDRRLCDLWVR